MLAILQKIALLILNLSLGLSLFRLLSLTVQSNWEVTSFRLKKLDFTVWWIAGGVLLISSQSYLFQHLEDWMLLFLLAGFSFEKGLWKWVHTKRNSVLFLLLIGIALFFQIEWLFVFQKHHSDIDPLILIYSSIVYGMVIWLLFSGVKNPVNAKKYLFYAVFFKAYLYFVKVLIIWYAGFPEEIAMINWQSMVFSLNILLGIIGPFILSFHNLFQSEKLLKVGLYAILISSVFEVMLFY